MFVYHEVINKYFLSILNIELQNIQQPNLATEIKTNLSFNTLIIEDIFYLSEFKLFKRLEKI